MPEIKGPITFGKQAQEVNGQLKEAVANFLGIRSISKEEAKKKRQEFGLPD